jgi:hypothetical protein
MRNVVDLPQPDGPTSTTNSFVGDIEIDRADRFDIIVILDNLAKRNLRHVYPSP